MEDSAVRRGALSAERAATLTRIEALAAEFDEIVAASEDANGDDEHDPEGSTVAFERARVEALARDARAYLAQLDLALARLDAGAYWTCGSCGGSIAVERLEALPGTARCVSCAAVS